ncbi:exosortase A [Leptolyngbya sp. 15MV]|nr:exosortase A [Leptolyngbya sp. 15MV]
MPPDTIALDRTAFALPEAWRLPLIRLAAAWAALFVLTRQDWAAMAHQWWNVSTYNHILFIPVIVGWLVWIRRGELARIEPGAWWPGLLALAGALFVWLLGTLGGVNIVAQVGAVMALQAAVLTLLGPRIVAALLFPLAYALFLVPFGDELVPALQMVTARMTIALTRWSGVPAEVDGVFIDTPAGLFEVAEACSGVQFLVAMIAFAALVAHSCFRSWTRRAVFAAVALVLPVLANGVRAWGTIYIAQSQGIAFAAGFDHVFYGWIFFALVVAILLALSWRWFDRDPEDPQIDGAAIANDPRLGGFAMAGPAALGAVLALAGAFALWLAGASRVEAALADRITPPDVPGWARTGTRPEIAWEPRAAGADRRLLARYRDGSGGEVDVFLALYAAQDERRDATASGEGALPPGGAWRWLSPGPAVADAKADMLLAQGQVKRLSHTSWRTGDLMTASVPAMKLAVTRDAILLRPRPAMMLIVSGEGRDSAELADRLDRFAAAMGDRGEWMDRAADVR